MTDGAQKGFSPRMVDAEPEVLDRLLGAIEGGQVVSVQLDALPGELLGACFEQGLDLRAQ